MLLIHPIGYDRSGQNRSLGNEELISRKAEYRSTTNDLTVHFGQFISTKKKGPFVRNTASLNAYWQTVYVHVRSIRYAIDFPTAAGKKALQVSIDLLKFFKPRPPRAICLIEQATDNLINFKQLSRKCFVSLSYSSVCRIFQQQSQKDSVSNKELIKCCRIFKLSTVVKKRFRYYRLFRANYDTVLQY